MRAAVADARVQPVLNLMLNPLSANVTGWGENAGGTVTWATDHLTSKRTTNGNVQVRTGPLTDVPVTPGQVLRVIAEARAVAGRGLILRLEWRAAGSVPISTVSTTTTATGDFQPLSVTTGPAPATATLARIWCSNSADALAGEALDVRHVMLADGRYTGPYRDGDTPGWHWLGVVGASASVGYPPPASS